MNKPTLDATQDGSEILMAVGSIDLSAKIPPRRKDPIIEVKRFLKTELLEEWQRDNPDYSIFTTEFHPCNEEGYDVAIYVTCGNLKEWNDHNDRVDALQKMRNDCLMAAAEADPDVISTPPDSDDTDMSPPDSAEPIIKPKKNAK